MDFGQSSRQMNHFRDGTNCRTPSDFATCFLPVEVVYCAEVTCISDRITVSHVSTDVESESMGGLADLGMPRMER